MCTFPRTRKRFENSYVIYAVFSEQILQRGSNLRKTDGSQGDIKQRTWRLSDLRRMAPTTPLKTVNTFFTTAENRNKYSTTLGHSLLEKMPTILLCFHDVWDVRLVHA